MANRLTVPQENAIRSLCDRYNVRYMASDYLPQFDLPKGYVGGWVGGPSQRDKTIFIGCDPEGRVSS